MRSAAPLLLLLLPLLLAADTAPDDSSSVSDDVILLANDTLVNDANGTAIEEDGDHEPIVRKKRTFGDIVFRGLADVLGYNVARKPPQAAFPPPLAPVPGIDTPLQAAPSVAPAPAQAGPAPAPVAPAPCGTPRAAGPSPCRAQRPTKPRPPPPCPKPRAAPRPKPRPTPPPPSPPPCASPRANPTTPSPCAPAPPPPPPPPPKQQAEGSLERVSSNFQLNFNFNRSPVTQGSASTPTADDDNANADNNAEQEAEPEQEQAAPVLPIVPIAIEPRAAKLPPAEPRNPRVYVDAFLVRNGVAQRVHTLDANRFEPQNAVDEDYLSYNEQTEQQQDDDYEDVQESRDREKAVQDFGVAVDRFWEQKKPQRKPQPRHLPSNHYQNVHFGDRDLAGQIRLQSLQREHIDPNLIPLPLSESEDDAEATTTTEDPKRPLRPRVLPPTEHNPNQIDTVTVRVPPIYKEKRPKKLHRKRPDRDEEETEEGNDVSEGYTQEHERDAEGEDSWVAPRTEQPVRRKRRRKQHRKVRSADESGPYSAGDYDYYGNKLPVSREEKLFMRLTVPPPTKDADLARLEAPDNDHFLDEHERLRDDPERIRDVQKSDEKSDEKGRADETERSIDDKERASSKERADEYERTDALSPNAQVHETGYKNNYVHATNVQVDDPSPALRVVKRKKVKHVKP